ncbi:MAG: CHAT domain-containing protein [Spirulina sp.]
MAFVSLAASTLLLAPATPAQDLIAGSNTSETDIRLTPEEVQVQQQFESAILLGQELAALEQIPTAERTPEQEQRILALRQAQSELSRAFANFANSPEIQAQLNQLRRSTQGQALELNDLRAIQDNLAQLDTPALLLYPLILDDRLELMVVTADAPPLRRTVEVTSTELNQTIMAFREALQDPGSDVLPPAQQLYQWLIQPIDADLAEAGAEAILVAPDGALRYVPLAALHDGDQWLAERFALNTLIAAGLMDWSTNNPRPEPQILAAALSEGPYAVIVGDQEVVLSPIPGAVAEVEAVATIFPSTTILMGAAFTPEVIAQRANHYDILHLATHTLVQPGSPEDSFMLFGNGEVLTLGDFRTWNLANVELVVLSGGDTGVGVQLGDGTEILGMGYEFQQAGARAVMASLWNVSDFGTTELMTAFYTSLSQGNSFAEALQQAQISLISSVPELTRHHQKASVMIESPSEAVEPQAANYSHPYYWAPFILIGNGL